MEEDFAEGVCCIAGLNFVIFARKYSFAEGVCCIVGRNFVIITIDYNRMKFQRRGCADCGFFCIFLPEVCFVSVHNTVYLYVSLHIFFLFYMKDDVMLFIVVELKRRFFFSFREIGFSEACIAIVQIHLRKRIGQMIMFCSSSVRRSERHM